MDTGMYLGDEQATLQRIRQMRLDNVISIRDMAATQLEALPARLKDRALPLVNLLRDVRSRVEQDGDGGTMVMLTFILADPPDGAETWPVEQLWELRQIAREVVPAVLNDAVASAMDELSVPAHLVPRFSWAVEFEPEHMPPLSSDDTSVDL
jgi:hypothetical protein